MRPQLDPSHLHAERTVPLKGDPIDRVGVRRLVAAAYRAGQYAAPRPQLEPELEAARARIAELEEQLDGARIVVRMALAEDVSS